MNVLIIGANGQIGRELFLTLKEKENVNKVIPSDIREPDHADFSDADFYKLDVLNQQALKDIIEEHKIDEVYLLAALLSATAEINPEFAWQLNMDGLFNVLNLAKDGSIKKIFWPSSIAVFGPTSPTIETPQYTVMQPTTVYGISKLAGEQWCEYYHLKHGVDVRSLRYPGLIGYKSLPGGGTTDYAVDIFYKAKSEKKFECFLSENTALPMMYMPDAIRATIELMEAPRKNLTVNNSYNLGGISFTPREISEEIQQHIPEFKISYRPDFRQAIADSWPSSIDDSSAEKEWNWKLEYNLEKMVTEMLDNISV